ncbi:alkaline phosphatase D family protein [Actinomadura parmotrematis]|uniref:Alkaline phosphatase family protein n=1 Tax=Actinomadura parmotrematis TaxID=2864039 RepID=A0ABS7FP42_9ACTN|nr:alkaline phosphatase D family protein [Actinomadura parmotrematis]MBW8481990.1 alkaline phosphatase family protein [Actinomadura parmotrematis]
MTALVIGPLLRHVGEHTATIWVETARPCEVRVTGDGVDAAAPTFTVHGHHYALVEVGGLPAGARIPYEVALDGERVWPEESTRFPPSALRTLDPGSGLALSFGSCRRSPGTVEMYGVDVLSALAHGLTEGTAEWPDALLMVGDQVYADEISDEMRQFVHARRPAGQEPVDEIADYEDYTRLYALAWREDPAVRWLLSTLPTFMIFDDHDVRDDWNTSHTWRRQMWETSWWRDRIVGGIASYWVYQHLGNLDPAERAGDAVYRAVREAAEKGEDAGALLDAFAERADKEPSSARWSYAHDWGGTRLVVVDSRCSRLLTPERRGMLDDEEFAWLDGRLQGGVDHLLVASSLPYLLAPTIHHAEAWNEAVAEGAWGRRAGTYGEKLRQGADLEHWGAFGASFERVARDIVAVGRGERGAAPATIAFLSGDVHYSYVARVTSPGTASEIVQLVCSPLRNPLPPSFRFAQRVGTMRGLAVIPRLLARWAKVPRPPLKWRLTDGPWFDNAVATVRVDGRECRVQWDTPASETAVKRLAQVRVTG